MADSHPFGKSEIRRGELPRILDSLFSDKFVMSLTFLNPTLLIGTAAAGVPFVLHLLSRQRSKRIPFSTLIFLKQVDVNTARRHKLVDLLLLLSRIFIILLIALALAKPVWRVAGDVRLARGNTARIIILDDSFSTALRYREQILFAREREFAIAAIETLRSGDAAAVITSSGSAPADVASLTGNIPRLADAVKNLKPSDSARPLIPAIKRAVHILSKSQKPVREIMLISDSQARAFEPRSAIQALHLKKSAPFIYICSVAPEKEIQNLTITKALINSPLPFPGFDICIEVYIQNHSEKPADTEVSLWDTTQLIERRTIHIPPVAIASVPFKFMPGSPGILTGRIALGGDALEADNYYYYHSDILKSVRLLIMTAEGMRPTETDGSLFLAAAFEPLKKAVNGRQLCRVDYAFPDQQANLTLKDYDVLFFVDVQDLTTTARYALMKYLKSGGNAVFFIGANIPESAAENFFYGDDTIFPFRLEHTWGQNGEAKSFGELDRNHPIIGALESTPDIDFSAVRFFHGWKIRLRSGTSARILARARDGSPLIIENRIGSGKALTFLSGISPESSNLATRPLFIPLLYESIKYLLTDSGGGYTRVGEPVRLTRIPPPSVLTPYILEVTAPDKKIHKLSVENGREMVFTDTRLAGNYHLRFGEKGHITEGAFSVNVDPAEGDLSRISNTGLKKIFPRNLPISFCRSPAELKKIMRARRKGKSLSHYLLLAALLLFIAESYLANSLLIRRRGQIEVQEMAPQKGWTQ